LKSRNDTTHDAVRAQGEAAEAKQKRLQRPNKINYQAFMEADVVDLDTASSCHSTFRRFPCVCHFVNPYGKIGGGTDRRPL
jgi:hypothetical protein